MLSIVHVFPSWHCVKTLLNALKITETLVVLPFFPGFIFSMVKKETNKKGCTYTVKKYSYQRIFYYVLHTKNIDLKEWVLTFEHEC